MTVATAQIVKVQQAKLITCAYVYEGPSGNWIVQDEMDSRGGLFTNRKAALKFVRHEFGPDTEIVMAAPSTASENHLQIVPSTPHRDVVRDEQVTRTNRKENTEQHRSDVLEGLFNRDAWDRNVHDISDAASMKSCWDVAAQNLIQKSGLAA
jgi:hypothetical protein